MRTVLLANRRMGVAVGRYLKSRGELEGVVVHPGDEAEPRRELLSLAPRTWEWPGGRDEISALRPECLFSVLFHYRLPPDWLCIPTWRPINLHPGLLPYNRGRASHMWPLIDGTPAGTTLHVMDEGLDTGPILCQDEVPVYHEDTGTSVYGRLEAASLAMLHAIWPRIRDVEPRPQVGEGTVHRSAEVQRLELEPRDFAVLDRIRALTLRSAGAEFRRDGVRYRARIEIERLS